MWDFVIIYFLCCHINCFSVCHSARDNLIRLFTLFQDGFNSNLWYLCMHIWILWLIVSLKLHYTVSFHPEKNCTHFMHGSCWIKNQPPVNYLSHVSNWFVQCTVSLQAQGSDIEKPQNHYRNFIDIKVCVFFVWVSFPSGSNYLKFKCHLSTVARNFGL